MATTPLIAQPQPNLAMTDRVTDTEPTEPPSTPMPLRTPLRMIGQGIGLLGALPHLAAFALETYVTGRDKAFRARSERIAGMSGVVGVYARQWFYRFTLQEVGDDVQFGYMSMFSRADIRVGDRVNIGRFCSIGWADLDDDAVLGDSVQVLAGQPAPRRDRGRHAGRQAAGAKVVVGRGATVGAGAVVMADVREGAAVGPGAVIKQPVEAGVQVVLAPAPAHEKSSWAAAA